MPLSVEDLESIRSDCFANDVPYDDRFLDCTEDDLTECK